MLTIEAIRDDGQARAAEALAWEFVAWLRARYTERLDEIETYLTGQRFAERMADVRVDYGPPRGEAFLALLESEPVGLLMMRDLGGGACEMNRMFVRPEARGHGVARALAERLIETARGLGFAEMRLTAWPRHHEALSLYRSLGFVTNDSQRLDGDTASSVKMALDLRA